MTTGGSNERGIRVRVDEEVSLEALMAPGQGRDTAILCHPHPLFGGSMDNNVVAAGRDAYARHGFGTLRFNFRGVGGSGGAHGGGKGEVDDLAAVWSHVGDLGPRHAFGYSFGSWIVARALSEGRISPATMVLVSPPVGLLDFSGVKLADGVPTLVLVGDRDAYAPLASVERWFDEAVRGKSAALRVVGECDHFWWGRESELAAAIGERLV